jgi:hypothetical protein
MLGYGVYTQVNIEILMRFFGKPDSIFLDLPSLTLRQDSLDDRRLLNARIGRALDIREWHRAPVDDKPTFPRNFDAYLDELNSRATGQQYGNIRSLYFDAVVGDIVVVPVDASFESYLMIGEITHPFNPDDHQRVGLYGNDVVPFRRVRWINAAQKTRLVSRQLAGELRGRRAIRLLAGESEEPARDRIYTEVFELSYRDFIYKDLCEYVFEAPNYHKKALDIFPGAELLSAILAYANASLDKKVPTLGDLTVSNASDSAFAEEGVEAFELDFASPGSYRIKTRGRPSVLLAVGALVACMGVGFSVGEMRAVQVVNSSPIPTDMTTATRDLVEQIVEGTGMPQIRELIGLERRAREKVGLRSKPRAHR